MWMTGLVTLVLMQERAMVPPQVMAPQVIPPQSMVPPQSMDCNPIKYYVVLTMLMEPSLLLVALTLLQGYLQTQDH